jgi:hypothetical protein
LPTSGELLIRSRASAHGRATLTTDRLISIPYAGDENGMPFGLQMTGRFRGNVELLDAAEVIEVAFTRISGLERPRPDLGQLAAARVDLMSLFLRSAGVASLRSAQGRAVVAVGQLQIVHG